MEDCNGVGDDDYGITDKDGKMSSLSTGSCLARIKKKKKKKCLVAMMVLLIAMRNMIHTSLAWD